MRWLSSFVGMAALVGLCAVAYLLYERFGVGSQVAAVILLCCIFIVTIPRRVRHNAFLLSRHFAWAMVVLAPAAVAGNFASSSLGLPSWYTANAVLMILSSAAIYSVVAWCETRYVRAHVLQAPYISRGFKRAYLSMPLPPLSLGFVIGVVIHAAVRI